MRQRRIRGLPLASRLSCSLPSILTWIQTRSGPLAPLPGFLHGPVLPPRQMTQAGAGVCLSRDTSCHEDVATTGSWGHLAMGAREAACWSPWCPGAALVPCLLEDCMATWQQVLVRNKPRGFGNEAGATEVTALELVQTQSSGQPGREHPTEVA